MQLLVFVCVDCRIAHQRPQIMNSTWLKGLLSWHLRAITPWSDGKERQTSYPHNIKIKLYTSQTAEIMTHASKMRVSKVQVILENLQIPRQNAIHYRPKARHENVICLDNRRKWNDKARFGHEQSHLLQCNINGTLGD